MKDIISSISRELQHLASSYVSERIFADGEVLLGKRVHLNDGLYWIQKDLFYCKPLHEFRPLYPGNQSPDFFKSLIGYSHQVDALFPASFETRWNLIQGDELRLFSLDCLPVKKRNNLRQGLKNCQVKLVDDIEPLFPEMKGINILQARRFDRHGDKRAYLSANYYEDNEEEWRHDIRNVFHHPGHSFIGAFVDDHLAAYIDLVQIEDTWMFGSVKSHDDFLPFRPVDALYFSILTAAASNPHCKRVVNGGGQEREGLIRFKSQFLLKSVYIPYHICSRLPKSLLAKARKLRLRQA